MVYILREKKFVHDIIYQRKALSQEMQLFIADSECEQNEIK